MVGDDEPAARGRLMNFSPPPPITVHADFQNDVRVHVLQLLTQAGVSLPKNQQSDPHRVCVAYFNVRHKVIEPRQRRVHRSRELNTRPFSSDVIAGVQLIEARSIAGESLEAHFSERAMRPHTHDWLLNDWGIHHLHVRPNRGDEVVYAWLEADDLYLVDVRGHQAMADVGLLEIVLANWPELLQLMPIFRIERGRGNPSADELDSARRAGVQPLVTLSDGQVYAPRGGGLTTAGGSSARAISQADQVLAKASNIEAEFRKSSGGLAAAVNVSELDLSYDPAAGTVTELKTGQVWAAR